jgi:putative ABC transport system permease protein
MHLVSTRFVETFGLRIVDGRGFGSEPSREALVNRALARSGFLGGTPVGQRIYSSNDRWWEVVGILDDVRQWGLDRAPSPAIYVVDYVGPPPGLGGSYFAVRSEQDPGALAQAVRGIARQLDPEATIDNVATMTEIVSSSIARPRMYTALLSIFAACAAALAAIGVYGVMAYSVSQRTREIGIRTAIGAAQADILRLVLREGLLMTVVGLGLGLAGAAVLTRYFESLLFGVSPLDPLTFVAAAVLFGAVATLAALIPARRATRVNPLVALRVE